MRVLTLFCLLSALAFGESISGTVNDPFGHPVGVATVQAKNASTGTVYKGMAKPTGEFVIANVPPGTYDVSTAVPAVKLWQQKGVVVEAGKTVALNIKLEETTQLNTLGEDTLGAIADAQRHKPPTGPAPRMVDGKVDFSGVWWRPSEVDPGKPEWLASAQDVAKQRLAVNSKESPQAMCLPSPVTRWGPLVELAQTKSYVVVINDDESPGFHQWYLDGRTHPKELDRDLWYGDSVAHWEDDTLVVDRVGFNDRVWLDQGAHPHSDQLHVVERYKRPDLGHLEQTVTVEDPGVLAKPWTMKRSFDLAAGETIREFICAENNRDAAHLVGK